MMKISKPVFLSAFFLLGLNLQAQKDILQKYDSQLYQYEDNNEHFKKSLPVHFRYYTEFPDLKPSPGLVPYRPGILSIEKNGVRYLNGKKYNIKIKQPDISNVIPMPKAYIVERPSRVRSKRRYFGVYHK